MLTFRKGTVEFTMQHLIRFFIIICFLAATPLVTAQEDSDDQRIRQLEEQLDAQREMIQQQQALLETMQSELESLKRPRSEAAVSVVPDAPVTEGQIGADEDAWVTGVVVESEDEPGFQPYLEISGFANLDMIYDFDRVAPIWESTLVPTTIPTVPGQYGSDGNFVSSIKQSKLSFVSETDTPIGRAKGWIEFDLFGTGSNAGSTAFNLRHAWFEVGNWGAGQTWSTFMDISTWPNVYDWWGPSGMVLNRNPMVRYTKSLDDRGSHFAVALEQQNASFNAGIFTDLAPGLAENLSAKSELPDLIARWRTVGDWGHFQAAGVARQLAFETLNTPTNDPSGTEFGWGFNLTGIFNVFGRDQIKYGLTFGEGIASFINDGGGSNLAPEFTGPGVDEVAMKSVSYLLYYDHYWSENWSSSIGISQNDNDLTNLQLTDQPDKVTYASTNLFYSLSPSFVTGFEALYGKLELADGSEGTDFRIQFTTRYNFSHKFSSWE